MLGKLSIKLITKRICLLLALALLLPVLFGTYSYADTAGELLSGENVGASMVLSTDAYNNAATSGLGVKLRPNEEIESSDLVMVALTSSLNVRSEGNADAEIVGKIYRDCGGIVLEKGESWSLIESGDLIGWCNNKYLLFGQDAIDLAKDVGTMTATVTATCTPVYSSDAADKVIIGYASEKALFEVIYEDNVDDEDWVCVDYDELDGFVKMNSWKSNLSSTTARPLKPSAKEDVKKPKRKRNWFAATKLLRQTMTPLRFLLPSSGASPEARATKVSWLWAL